MFIDILQQFLEDPQRRDWSDEVSESTLRMGTVYKPTNEEPDVIAAWVKSGEKGFASEIFESEEGGVGEQPSYRRKPEDVEFIPVLLLAKLPAMRSRGFLVCHSPKNRGIKTKFWDSFKTWFRERYPHLSVEINFCTPEGFHKKLIAEEQLKKVTYIRHMKPTDMFGDTGSWFDSKTLGDVRTVVSPRGRRARLSKKPLEQALEDDKSLSSLLEFDGQTYDEVRTTFIDRRGREHSILLGPEGEKTPRAGYDVTDHLSFAQDGHPTYESLRQAMLGYIEILTPSSEES
ncbi:hypothetical protein [Actinomadura nitritigenes]|uniref:Uncharacterized protein n=1 Tax=Actinomadura nitritigenes TaxID=134602 RepID=A0ABS3QY40_9ACTN|nr:hypothetical protein [Actinomadura nitritigenes]MBO2438918.1 hypothetical protein [Actinomadura nitritigenes]